MHRLSLPIAMLSLLACAPSLAANEPVTPGATRVTLEVSAEREVNHDLMQATLSIEADDTNLSRLADTMKQKLDWGMKTAQESPYIQVETGDYRIYPIYDRYDPYRFSHWWASQELRLRSTQFAPLSQVLGNLQGKLAVRSVVYSLSPEARRDTENKLLDDALKSFRDRAALLQRGLSAGSYRIVSLDIHVPAAPVPTQTARPATGGEQVTIELIGSVELK